MLKINKPVAGPERRSFDVMPVMAFDHWHEGHYWDNLFLCGTPFRRGEYDILLFALVINFKV